MASPIIALVAPTLGGGIGRNIVNLANAFYSKGYGIHLVLDELGDEYADQIKNGIGIVRMPTSHAYTGVPFLGAYLLRCKPDVVLTPNVRQTVLALRTRSVLRASTRVFTNIHSTFSELFKTLSPNKCVRHVSHIRRWYPRCNRVIAVSKGVADDLVSLTGIAADNVTTIYNPVVTEELERLSRAPLDHPWFQPGQPPVILTVGRLEVEKNFMLLIDAFERIRAITACRLVIIGEGTERKNIELRVGKSMFAADIALLGHQSNPYRYMRNSAVFALTSTFEGFGNVIVEALATGTPVVSTDCPHGPREILAGGRYGTLVQSYDPDAFAEALRRTLTSRPVTPFKEAVAPFTADTVAGQYLQAFGIS